VTLHPARSDYATIVWRRLDAPGHEAAELRRVAGGWMLSGVAVLVDEGRPCRLEYVIACGGDWCTRTCEVRGHIGPDRVHLDLARDETGSWTVNREHAPALAACHDVDLGFSPSTNLLPIRRLELAVGASAPVRAAWVRFPELSVEVLAQTYTRTAPETYHYESGGTFRRDLIVDANGLVLDYPGLWLADAPATGRHPG
jgi:hypothetical protein